MTQSRFDNWKVSDPGAYRQQTIHNPASGQEPNNARHAVWHFSKVYNVHRFENPPRWGDDGRGRRGDPTIYQVMMNIQPMSKADYELFQIPEGARTEAMQYATMDPWIQNDQLPGYAGPDPIEPQYADGFWLRTGDQRTKIGGDPNIDLEENHAFPDLVEYDGLLWKVLKVDYHHASEEELFQDRGRICHAVLSYFDDSHQERQAGLEERQTFDGTFPA